MRNRLTFPRKTTLNRDASRLKQAVKAFSYMDWAKMDDLVRDYKDIYYASDEHADRGVEKVLVLTQSELAEVLPAIELQQDSQRVTDTLRSLFSISEVFGWPGNEPRYEVHVAKLLTNIALLSPNCENVDKDAKARLVFNMIDVGGTGFIVRDEICATIQNSALDNALQLSQMELAAVAECLMRHMDVDNDNRISFDEFKSSVDTNDAMLNPLFAERKAVNFLLRSNYALTDEEDIVDPKKWSIYRRIMVFLSLHAREAWCIAAYVLINCGMFATYFTLFWNKKEIVGSLGHGVPVAKGFAGILYFNIPLLFITMSRTLLTNARATWLENVIPFDHAILFHQVVGYIVVMAATGHACSHLFSTFKTLGDLTDLATVNSLILGRKFPSNPSYSELLFTTVPGLTGVLSILALIICAVFSHPSIRRRHYNLFWYSHHAFIIFAACQIVHGTWQWVQFPHMFIYLGLPLLIYLGERVLRTYRGVFVKYDITELEVQAEKTVKIVLTPRNQRNRQYRPGQYIYLKFPAISKFEWHPFTLTSSPLDNTLVVYIRCNGDWTGEVLKLARCQPELLHDVHVNGPLGAPSQHYDDFENLMLIGTGIGVTPFASILRDMQIRILEKREQPTIKLQRVDFYWINRSRGAFSWFTKLLKTIESESTDNLVRIHTFITSANSSRDVRSVLLWKGLQLLRNESRASVLTGLTREAYWGRPDWAEVFEQTAATFAGGTVGVFFCGPEILAEELWELSRKTTASTNCRFVFRMENF